MEAARCVILWAENNIKTLKKCKMGVRSVSFSRKSKDSNQIFLRLFEVFQNLNLFSYNFSPTKLKTAIKTPTAPKSFPRIIQLNIFLFCFVIDASESWFGARAGIDRRQNALC